MTTAGYAAPSSSSANLPSPSVASTAAGIPQSRPGNPPAASCTYADGSGYTCARTPNPSNHDCVFHLGWTTERDKTPPSNPLFAQAFAALISAKDGDWRGFVFPEDVKFPSLVDFRVCAIGARFSNRRLVDVTFGEEVDLSGSLFLGTLTLRNVTMAATANFERCTFDCPVDFGQVRFQGASFHRATFSQRSIIRANFAGSANFNEATFRDAVVFTGWRNINVRLSGVLGNATVSALGTVTGTKASFRQQITQALHRIWVAASAAGNWAQRKAAIVRDLMTRWFRVLQRRVATVDPNTDVFAMFEGEGQMQDVVFLKPEQTVFSQVDLSRVYFRGTNLRGVRFLGVNWWQPKLRRNGLYDEVFIARSPDGPFRHAYLPALEETCRNARAALEDNRNYNSASDFYVGEMEAMRHRLPLIQRHLLSVAALYRFVSRYGTSVAVALRVIGYLYALHLALTILLNGVALDVGSIAMTALRSLQLLGLQSMDHIQRMGNAGQAWLDTVFRVLVPIQLAMIVLAFRSRIKRH